MDSKKYIGMDVHKESISIAVMNGAGKIVMECVIETKASMILQFIDGLRGDLQVTFEEGTSAAWLYDLLKPHVTKVVVCDPRKNASMKEGNKSDKIDARRLAELLRLNHLNPVYHGEHGLRSLKELVRSYLTITKDLGRVMTRVKAIYRSWAIPCTGKQVYAPRHRAEWLGKIARTGSAPAGRVLLPTTRCAADGASGSAAGAVGGGQETPGLETALPDSLDRSDSGSRTAGHSADSAPFPHQAAAVDVQRIWHRDTQQRRSPECRRAAATSEETDLHSRTEPQLQSRSEESVQGRGDRGFEQTRSVSGVLHSFADQGHPAGDGASDLGQEDCHHRVDRVEERSVLRRPTSETTNSLSVSDRVRSILGISLVVAVGFSRHSGSRASLS